jgi:hypothetical protein
MSRISSRTRFSGIHGADGTRNGRPDSRSTYIMDEDFTITNNKLVVLRFPISTQKKTNWFW